jgi:hypothetical protein
LEDWQPEQLVELRKSKQHKNEAFVEAESNERDDSYCNDVDPWSMKTSVIRQKWLTEIDKVDKPMELIPLIISFVQALRSSIWKPNFNLSGWLTMLNSLSRTPINSSQELETGEAF